MNISVLGAGRWGSFIAWYLDKVGLNVTLWGRSTSSSFELLLKNRQNNYLKLPNSINLTTDLARAIDSTDILIISIKSQALRNFMNLIKNFNISQKKIVLCMKGIEEKTGKRLSQVVNEFTNSAVAIWVGPGHVQDFINNIPNCMVIDSTDESLKKDLVSLFSSNLIRFYLGSDLIGNEIGAATKNVIGIAAGMLDGIGFSCLKGALMSRGTREISRLIKAMGGSEYSAYGLSHLGDYQATLFSSYSNNRNFGESFIKETTYNKLAEGVSTAKALNLLSKRFNIDLPICHAVHSIIEQHLNPHKVLSNLFLRSIKYEF